MNVSYIRDRITQLRMQKGVSEYKMSLDLGHSKGYIQSISSGKSLPSVSELLYICEYFCIEPKDFFDEDSEPPQELRELQNAAKKLNSKDLKFIIDLTKRLQQ